VKIERLGSPDEFARRCATHLADCVLPDVAELSALVETTFFASLHEEEARHSEFSVAWQPRSDDCASVIAISPPVQATPKNLAKLAPATRGETSIAVRSDNGKLVAWALLEQRKPAHRPFTIRVLSSGVLRVDYAGAPRALYARGETYLLGGGSPVLSPAHILSRTFPAWQADSVHPNAAIVVELAARMLDHGHGGMLLLMPASQAAPAGVRVHYGVGTGEDVLARRLDAEAIELVARLSAIDNAILLDTDLRLRGFGTQVIEGDAPQMDFEHRDPYSDDVHVDDLSTFKGTRHPAGVIFCMRQPGAAAAIIASQDARLSLAVKNARGGVEVIGSYERAFGWPC
jgi:hypothetical protein